MTAIYFAFSIMLFVRPTNEARQLGTFLLKHWHTDFWQPLPLRHHARDHPERSDRVHHQLTASHSGHRTRWSPRARILRALKRRATRCCQRARRGSKFGADYNITVVPLEEIPYLARRIHTGVAAETGSLVFMDLPGSAWLY